MRKPAVVMGFTVVVSVFAGVLAIAQVPTVRRLRIIELDPALKDIIAPDAKLETLGDHFGLTEGPVWAQQGNDGYLVFSDNAGSNGLTLDAEGRLIITAMTDRTIVRLEKDSTRALLADRYEGKRFNGPNDIVGKSQDLLHRHRMGLRGAKKSPARELPYSGFFLIKDGKVTLLGGDKDNPGNAPNGIALSPDEKHLYVTAGPSKTMRYDVQPDDTVANPVKFLDGGNDGIKVDLKGNVYSTVRNEVWITSPEGRRLGMLELPQISTEPRPRIVATNLAFGDADSKTLHITACTNLFRIRLKVAGVQPGPQR